MKQIKHEYHIAKIDTTQKLYIIVVRNENFNGIFLSRKGQGGGSQDELIFMISDAKATTSE